MQTTGTLVGSVYTSAARIPIENALMTVTQRTDTPIPSLLALRLTDRSGKTAPITIGAPPPADSTAPGNPPGWTTVDIAVDQPGYLRARVEGVQIFPGSRTIQELELVPLPLDSLRQNEQQQFTQPIQAL